MCQYCNTKYYRKIYENHIGPIPIDVDGKSYDIHHIDGNHKNNNPSNLKAVTIREHYEIHHLQGDYGACYFITVQRLTATSEEISKKASENAKQSNVKRWQDPIWAARTSANISKSKSTPERKQHARQQRIKRNKSLEFKERLKEAWAIKLADPNWRKEYQQIQKKAAETKMKPIKIDTTVFKNASEAAEKYNISIGTVRQRIKSKTNKFKNWSYLPEMPAL